jgi:hypothetical protein
LSGDGAGFPEVAEEVTAEEFDFFSVVARGFFNGFGAGIAKNAAGKISASAWDGQRTLSLIASSAGLL